MNVYTRKNTNDNSSMDAGRWTLDAGCCSLDVKILKYKTVQNFENNEAISTTSFFQAPLSNHLKI